MKAVNNWHITDTDQLSQYPYVIDRLNINNEGVKTIHGLGDRIIKMRHKRFCKDMNDHIGTL